MFYTLRGDVQFTGTFELERAALYTCQKCGNGVMDDGEECDDGGTDNGDGCDENCISEHPSSNRKNRLKGGKFNPNNCGNGHIEWATGEECDDGNNVDGDMCSHDCKIENQPV